MFIFEAFLLSDSSEPSRNAVPISILPSGFPALKFLVSPHSSSTSTCRMPLAPHKNLMMFLSYPF